MRLGHVGALDGVRALAVTFVIGSHLLVPGFAGGGVGVLVFFVLSGFLITTLLLEDRDRRGDIGLGRFYVRRLLRLWPALLLMVAVTDAYMLASPDDPSRHATLHGTLPAVFYYDNWATWANGIYSTAFLGHTWSLAAEEQFYLLWPLLLLLFLRRGSEATLIPWLLGACGVVLGLRLALYQPGHGDHLQRGMHTVADQLLYGCALAVAIRQPRLRELARRVGTAGALAGAAVVTAVAMLPEIGGEAADHAYFTVGLTLAAIGSAVVLAHLVTEQDSPLSRLLSLPPLQYLGRISYGMYLFHIVVIYGLRDHLTFGNKPEYYLAGYVLTVLVASVSFWLWEQPFLKLKDRLGGHPDQATGRVYGSTERAVPVVRIRNGS